MILEKQIQNYIAYNEQEENDKRIMLKYINCNHDVLTRNNEIAHFTASAWVINPNENKLLMIYHNIYKSWAWTGGHADGEEDLLSVAIREVQEETGITKVVPVIDNIFSLEIITVDGHMKRGKYVSSHLHLNVTFLLKALEDEKLAIKPDENKGVKWMEIEEAVSSSNEPWMQEIYRKLNRKLKGIMLA
ncbi:MAG TPA: NUDIX hydrolase [Clostridiales bacterium]|nr:NUDIX hydrolase [Clostridiales bacterium]